MLGYHGLNVISPIVAVVIYVTFGGKNRLDVPYSSVSIAKQNALRIKWITME